MMNRWFTHYLHGVDNGVENDAKAWIVRENDDRLKPTAYTDYPNPDAELVTLHLGKGGMKAGNLMMKAAEKQGEEVLMDDATISGIELAQTTESKNRLLYVSPVLKEDLHISGLAKVSITLASSKPAANLSVWLVSLPWNAEKGAKITDNIITRGWAEPQNHKSISESEPLEPGKFYTINFDLQPDDQVIPKGQQIGLMIFSSDNQYTILPTPGTKLTIDLDKTTLQLQLLEVNLV